MDIAILSNDKPRDYVDGMSSAHFRLSDVLDHLSKVVERTDISVTSNTPLGNSKILKMEYSGLVAYNFEPEYTEEELQQLRDNFVVRENSQESSAERKGSGNRN